MKVLLFVLMVFCAFFFGANVFVLLFSGFTAINAIAATTNAIALIVLTPLVFKD